MLQRLEAKEGKKRDAEMPAVLTAEEDEALLRFYQKHIPELCNVSPSELKADQESKRPEDPWSQWSSRKLL